MAADRSRGGAERRRAYSRPDPRIVVYAGGIPLLAGGELVGGLGASGGTAAEDEECVLAAARSVGFD